MKIPAPSHHGVPDFFHTPLNLCPPSRNNDGPHIFIDILGQPKQYMQNRMVELLIFSLKVKILYLYSKYVCYFEDYIFDGNILLDLNSKTSWICDVYLFIFFTLQEFWDYLFSQAVQWGLVVYEQVS